MPCSSSRSSLTLAGSIGLVKLGQRYRLIAGDVPYVNTAIGEHEMHGRGAFLCAPMTARTAAADVSQRYSICIQQMLDFELGEIDHIGL